MNDQGMDGFAARLNELCNDKKLPGRGRAELLGKRFKVSREAARKWLTGQGYPTLAKRLEICHWANVTDVWLTTGKGDKHPVASTMTEHQRHAMDYMAHMTLEEQELAVRLLAQLADPHGTKRRPGDDDDQPSGIAGGRRH